MNKALLLILDGWGIRKDETHNAIAQARPTYWHSLLEQFPHTQVHCKEESVGVPKGCLSNSDIGHAAIGAGRVVPQSAFAVNEAIKDGSFAQVEALEKTKAHLDAHSGKLHLIGLLSDGGVHAHIDHVIALLEWSQRHAFPEIVLHLFLDGRDMAPKSALPLLQVIQSYAKEHIRIGSMGGRSIGMDRTENWDRTQSAFQTITHGASPEKQTPEEWIKEHYAQGISDEFMPHASFSSDRIEKNDAVIFFNFRSDRMRQMVRLFCGLAPHAIQERTAVPENLCLASMANYDERFTNVHVLFPKQTPKNNLGEWVSTQGLKQLRLAETEKEAHVTYFINGSQEVTYPHEERLIIPSLGLKNYTTNPEMSLPEITNSLCRALERKHFELIVCNIANPDMLGHTGDMPATVQAVQHVDNALSRIIPAATEHGYTTLITADHGNAEYMMHDGAPHSAHTYNDVPLLITNPSLRLPETGFLNQTAPTILSLMGLPIPKEMDRDSLI